MATWETTFYYQQELKSSYMNNLINGLIRPGIYNLNASIYTESNAVEGKKPGVYLTIQEGAVFVFSNNYKVENNTRKRDLSEVGSYVVKCVLTETTNIPLSTISSGSVDIKAPKYITSTKRVPVSFVHASFNYDPENISSSAPTIELVLPSYYRDDYDIGLSNKLPNEDISLSSQDPYSSSNLSYLIIGALIDRSVPLLGSSNLPAYAEDNVWTETGQTEWINNHVFTGRGFPEYNESVLRTYGEQVPYMLFSPFYKNMYLTSGQFYYNGILYSIDGPSWKEVYGQGTTPLSIAPTAYTGFSTDGAFASAGDTNYITLGDPDFSGNKEKLVVEFLFMSLKSEYSRGGEGEDIYPDLSGIFNAENEVSKKLLPVRIVCDDPEVVSDFNTETLIGGDIQNTFGGGKAYIPLDVSKFNIKRLKKMLLNKNITLKVIDMIRQYADKKTPFLVAGDGDSLLPIMVSFRKINNIGTDYVDKKSSKDAVCTKDSSEVSTYYSAVNPANILSFFEVQSSGYSIQGATIAAQEVFTTLPFLGD